MPSICLLIGVKSSQEGVMALLNSTSGIASWWTADTQGNPDKGGVLHLRFDEATLTLLVLECSEQVVCWQCQDGPEEWIDTILMFSAAQKDDQTLVSFKHSGWKAESSFFHFCSMKWATFMLGIRDQAEQGKGRPFPDDVHVDYS